MGRWLHRWQGAACLALLCALAETTQAAKLTLLDGRVIEGVIGTVAGVAEDPEKSTAPGGEVDVRPILILDDGLKRLFISKRQVREVNEAAISGVEKINVLQSTAQVGPRIGGVGPILKITPFDQFGRRIFTMKTADGSLSVVQGITEVTPTWTKVEGLQGRRSYVWEMRVATNSIPRETLSKVLSGAINRERVEERLKIVRLYIQAERYKDAREELETIVGDFPDQKDLQDLVRALRQMGSRRLLQEIEMRAAAGQHRFVQSLLKNFPSEGVAGETLQKVRQIQADYAAQQARGTRVIKLLETYSAEVKDSVLRERVDAVRKEIVAEINYSTLGRFAPFLRLADDETLGAEQKLALAFSGWLLGGNEASENLKVALSLYEVRNLVRKYLNEPLAAERAEFLEAMRSQEGGEIAQVAKLLANMQPPQATAPREGDPPGYFELAVPGIEAEADVKYYVQLPPEYDPHRQYPTVVTLNGAGTSPLQQLDWWAGASGKDGMRLGQATRHGYIVIAVDWQKPHQSKYEYSAREHAAVLSCLRDALRRFSINTDKVFLTGHSMGGDAAWDLALSHPDLWAGVIPIVATADRYCAYYWENARYVPLYIVAGEMDGGRMAHNARELDRYLRRGYDTTVVEYLGRGHEHFYDEVQTLFEWMNRRERNFYPKEFECASLRPWDNYFWWVELSNFPERTVVLPAHWPPSRGTRASLITAKINNSSVIVKSAAEKVTVWLSPELIDFQQRNTISINGRRISSNDPLISPRLEVLLEDARTRADRLHPFWARVDWP